MEEKPEALRLADLIGGNAAAELRRLYAENQNLRQALEQPAPAQQEPFAWADLNELTEQFNSVNCGTAYRLPGEGRQPLYTTSPAPAQPLTDEQILDAFCNTKNVHQFVQAFKAGARYAEAAHGITKGRA